MEDAEDSFQVSLTGFITVKNCDSIIVDQIVFSFAIGSVCE